jgi:Fe-S-cluster containining protein
VVSGFSILNLDTARFECTFGRGCDGICCRNGRPILYPEESALLDARLPSILPLLRPPARALVEKHGYLSHRRKCGHPMARVSDGWCVFFNEGCVLHRLGVAEGDAFRFKPAACSLFPLSKDERGRWYVRQKGYKGEIWDLTCLDPAWSGAPAVESLAAEIGFAQRLAEPRP